MSASVGKTGAVMLPPTAILTYRRLMMPAVQRTPWPKLSPALNAVPWISTEPTVGFSPAVVKTSVGVVSELEPAALIEAPPVAPLLSQPRLAPVGGLAHGQRLMPGSPGVQVYVADVLGQVRILRSQRTNVPPSRLASSLTVSVQSPLGSWPTKLSNEPSGAISGTTTRF